jgi:solute carrier family 39 (zinc transporter), member 7
MAIAGPRLCALFFFATLVLVGAEVLNDASVASLSPDRIERELEVSTSGLLGVIDLTLKQQCSIIQKLNAHKLATTSQTASITTRIFSLLFPSSSPAINALLATAYISGPPNFLLTLCPPNIDPASLTIMVAFAVGGLLGDTLFHLLPEIFLGEDHPDRVKLVLLEPNRNLLLGVGIMAGFVAFVAMDKSLRIATGEGGHSHSHSRSDSKDQPANSISSGSSTTQPANSELKKRKPDAAATTTTPQPTPTSQNPSVKLAGLLNLLADFTHNITDGLALSSSFYASPTLGATTCVAVFFHEIPHEVGDFALLIQSGFSKRRAMAAQFLTAVGAFLGTFIGIFVNEYGGGHDASHEMGPGQGIWGTSLSWGDMLLPFTAGTFLYVGTVAVIPELLENTGKTKGDELRKTGLQFLAMALGAGIMLAISWS